MNFFSLVEVLLALMLLNGNGRQCPAFLRTPVGLGRSAYTASTTSTTWNSPNNVGFGRKRSCCSRESRSFRTTCSAKKKNRKAEEGGSKAHTAGGNKTHKGHSTKGTKRSKEEEDFGDLLKSPQFLKRKIELIEKQLEEKGIEIDAARAEGDKECEEWGPMIERLRGEFDVVKERTMNEMLNAAGMAKVRMLKEVITVSDNFARATAAIKPTTPGAQKVKDNYDRIEKSMQDVFDKLGMKTIPTVGEPFDYELHQAVLSRPSEYEEDIVCQELEKGFVVDGKLIRPAMIVVSTG